MYIRTYVHIFLTVDNWVIRTDGQTSHVVLVPEIDTEFMYKYNINVCIYVHFLAYHTFTHTYVRTLTISLSSLICSMVRKSCSFTAESSLQPKNKRDRVNTSGNNENITLRQIIRNTRSQKYKHTYVHMYIYILYLWVCTYVRTCVCAYVTT